jgi:DNA recombination protein RmuC
MLETLLVLTVLLLVAALGLLVALWLRPHRLDLSPVESRLQSIESGQTQFDGRLQAFATQLGTGSEATERRMEALRNTVEARLTALQADNAAKLDTIRATVDERLQTTLETRLGASFKSVSDRLEQVHRGLGEMQALAAGVGDLKKVLTNVKTRGTWGEIQLGSLLEQVLAPGQYEANVATRPGSNERVEFAVKMPGHDAGGGVLWLPIDAKFPQEDYQRLLEAAERADADGVESAARQLEARIKQSARDIYEKYIDPPHTTDFGILFLPTEGLYAEALRRPGLSDAVQRDSRVVIAGPTTLWATLSSLQMGFRTLAIEKRSSEVWTTLGEVKTEFKKYGDLLDQVHKKLQEASHKVEDVARKGRRIERKLKDVQELPAGETPPLLGAVAVSGEPADADAGDDDDDPA